MKFSANRDTKKRLYRIQRLTLPFQIHVSHSKWQRHLCFLRLHFGSWQRFAHLETKLLFYNAHIGSDGGTGRERDDSLYDPQRGKKNVLNQNAVTHHSKGSFLKKMIHLQLRWGWVWKLNAHKKKKKKYSIWREKNSWGIFLFVYSVCSQRAVGTLVRRHIRQLQRWESVSWVAGPSLTLHTKPWQDVVFKACDPCDSLNPLLLCFWLVRE